jgi:hypothetical protein
MLQDILESFLRNFGEETGVLACKKWTARGLTEGI